MIKAIEARSQAVTALLTQLQDRVENPAPVLAAIGEDIVERMKERFGTSRAPDGTPWAANTQLTLMRFLEKKKGAFTKKKGTISAKGAQLAANKKPLIGAGRNLSTQIFHQVHDNGLTVGSSMRYAAMQQYGGTKSQFPNLWGDIPARPYFPIMANGALYPQEEALVLEQLREYLTIG